MTSHFDTLIAPRQKGERLLRKKISIVTTNHSFCVKILHTAIALRHGIYCKQMTALHGGCSLSGNRGKYNQGKSQPHKCWQSHVCNTDCASMIYPRALA
jgi:hypothetical protein